MKTLKSLLKPDKAKGLVAVVLLLLIALGWGQSWVFADRAAPPPPWALPEPLGMLAWTVAMYLMVPVMMLNLPLVLAFDLDLFRVPGLAAVLAVVMAYLWAVFFVTAIRILRRQGAAG